MRRLDARSPPIIAVLILSVYSACLLYLVANSFVQLDLVRQCRRAARQEPAATPAVDAADLPPVTVQLPVYNERYVIERLVDAAAALRYPADRLEIQLLDDSTDDTAELAARRAAHWRARGVDMKHIRRGARTGFKAGALAYGLERARGELVAVFDADFVPSPDFLEQTVPALLADPRLAVVQARWGHLNEDYSFLTRTQAFLLNAHFAVEQRGRCHGGMFMHFNGTAGVWRRAAIQDAGGWQHDTLTEDLDLSYRAQLRGWKIRFLERVEAPAELPVEMDAYRTQQYRWIKGGAETARKTLGAFLRAPGLTLRARVHGFFHLGTGFIFVAGLLSALLSLPVLWIKHAEPRLAAWCTACSLGVVGLVVLGFFFWTSIGDRPARGIALDRRGRVAYFAVMFPLFMSVTMGLSLQNTIAAVAGFLRVPSPFERTAKFNIADRKQSWRDKTSYLRRGKLWIVVLEGLLAAYFVGGIGLGFHLGDLGLFPYHVSVAFGFGLMFTYSAVHSWGIRPAAA